MSGLFNFLLGGAWALMGSYLVALVTNQTLDIRYWLLGSLFVVAAVLLPVATLYVFRQTQR